VASAGWKSMRFGRRPVGCPRAARLPEDTQAIVVRLEPGTGGSAPARIHHHWHCACMIFGSLPVAGENVIVLWLRLGDS